VKNPQLMIVIIPLISSLTACSLASEGTPPQAPNGGYSIHLEVGQLPQDAFSKGLAGDSAVASVEIFARSASGNSYGGINLVRQADGSWSGSMSLTQTGSIYFTAQAMTANGTAIYGGRAIQTMISSAGQSVTIPVSAQKLLIGTGRGGSGQLGEAIASDGTWLFSGGGAYSMGTGTVVVFKKTSGVWAYHSTLAASDAARGKYFGRALALAGTTLFVGCAKECASTVGVYVFSYNSSSDSWTQMAKLLSPSSSELGFGHSLAVSSDGTTLAIGAPRATPGSVSTAGAVYVYAKGSGWVDGSGNRVATLYSSAGKTNDLLGFSTSISSDGLLILSGATTASVSGISACGAAFAFAKGSAWANRAENAIIVPNDTSANAGFGNSIAINGTTLFVGSEMQNKVYVFSYDTAASSATQVAALAQPSGWAADPEFGYSLAISSDGASLLIGADVAAYPSSMEGSGAVALYLKGSGWANGSANYSASYRIPGFMLGEWAGWSVAWAGSQIALGIPGLDLYEATNIGAVALFP
jgi:hypothetical protein